MRSPPVHCASHKCIGHCADFRALPVAMLPALVRALLRSPPALRPALPRAVRSAPPATQSPWRLRSAGFTGVDLPIFHTARIAYPTGRAGLGFHTPRIGDAGLPWGSMSCLFDAFRGQTGSGDCWTEWMLWRTAAKLLESLLFFWRGSLENRPERPRVLWRTVDSGPRFSGEPSDSRTHRHVPDGIQRPARAATRRFGSRTGRIFERDMVQRAANATNLRSGFLKMTAEDSAIAASATTLDPNSRQSVTDPPFFAIGDKPEADPHRSRSDPSRPVRRRPQRPLIGSSRRWRAARRQGDTVLWALPRSAISRGV